MTTKPFSIVVIAALIATAGVVYAQQKPTPRKTPEPQKTFDTPEAATQALLDAASQNDVATVLRAVLGSSRQGHTHLRRSEARCSRASGVRQDCNRKASPRKIVHEFARDGSVNRRSGMAISDSAAPRRRKMAFRSPARGRGSSRRASWRRPQRAGCKSRPAPRSWVCSNPTLLRSAPRRARQSTRKRWRNSGVPKNSRRQPGKTPHRSPITAISSAC